jgi:hypothetical protein
MTDLLRLSEWAEGLAQEQTHTGKARNLRSLAALARAVHEAPSRCGTLNAGDCIDRTALLRAVEEAQRD